MYARDRRRFLANAISVSHCIYLSGVDNYRLVFALQIVINEDSSNGRDNMMRAFKSFGQLCAVFLMALVLTACSDGDTSTGGGSDAGGSQNVLNTINASPGQFSTFSTALDNAGLAPTLTQGGPFTIFAPTNAAFANVQQMVDSMSMNQLAVLLNFHVVPGINDASAIPPTSGAAPTIGEPINASNGVIFPISEVLLP